MNNTTLRVANKNDVELIFNWANDPLVRENAINKENIKWEDHRVWFNKRILSNKTHIFILEQDSIPVGQIRFDKDEDGFLIDYSVDSSFRKKGYGTMLVDQGCRSLKKELDTAVTILAQVKDINRGSSKIFINLGFILSEEQITGKQIIQIFKKIF